MFLLNNGAHLKRGDMSLNLLRGKKISLQWLLIISFVVTVICSWSYGNSYYLYVCTTVLLAGFSYFKFLSHSINGMTKIEFIVLCILAVNFFAGLFNGPLKSVVMVDISLLMPFVLSYFNITYQISEKQLVRLAIVNLLIIILLSLNSNMWNLNALAIVIFCGISVGFIWFEYSETIKSKIVAVVYMAIAVFYLLSTECRSAGLVIVFCIVLLLIPRKILENRYIFRLVYFGAILATIFSLNIMEMIFNNIKILGHLIDFTSLFSDKTYGMSSHLQILEFVRGEFEHLDILSRLFGQGVKTQNCHNLYYQCLFFYGYLGTAFIYGFFVFIFETGYGIYKRSKDKLILACCIALIGHLLMQCSEVYMYGLETNFMITAVPAAIILNRKRNNTIQS